MDNLKLEFELTNDKTEIGVNRIPSVEEMAQIIVILAKTIEGQSKGENVWHKRLKDDGQQQE